MWMNKPYTPEDVQLARSLLYDQPLSNLGILENLVRAELSRKEEAMDQRAYGTLPPPTYPGAATVSTTTRTVTIHKLLAGWVVQVGCQTIAFETIEKMLKEIGSYLKNPAKVEEAYLKAASAPVAA